MKRKNNKTSNKMIWAIISIIIGIICLFSFYFVRPLSYEEALVKANKYQIEGLYCSGYHIGKDGICEVVFGDMETIDVKDKTIADRIYNEFKK